MGLFNLTAGRVRAYRKVPPRVSGLLQLGFAPESLARILAEAHPEARRRRAPTWLRGRSRRRRAVAFMPLAGDCGDQRSSRGASKATSNAPLRRRAAARSPRSPAMSRHRAKHVSRGSLFVEAGGLGSDRPWGAEAISVSVGLLPQPVPVGPPIRPQAGADHIPPSTHDSRRNIIICIVVIAALAVFLEPAATADADETFKARLSGDQEAPARHRPGTTGKFEIQFNWGTLPRGESTLRVDAGVQVTQAHLAPCGCWFTVLIIICSPVSRAAATAPRATE